MYHYNIVFAGNKGGIRRIDSEASGRLTQEACMRVLMALLTGLCLAFSAAVAQAPSPPGGAAASADGLSLDQKIKISQLITKQAEPLTNSSFSIAVGTIVPPEISIRSLPAEAVEVAPRLRGFGYVVIEELVAIVDQRTRKVESVFPRWGGG